MKEFDIERYWDMKETEDREKAYNWMIRFADYDSEIREIRDFREFLKEEIQRMGITYFCLHEDAAFAPVLNIIKIKNVRFAMKTAIEYGFVKQLLHDLIFFGKFIDESELDLLGKEMSYQLGLDADLCFIVIQGIYDEFVDALQSGDYGKSICANLRQVEKMLAIAKGIPYEVTECYYDGPCMGVCPVCASKTEELLVAINAKELPDA